MTTGPCKNHPEITVRWRCYTCDQFICTQCKLLLSHHYFCSERCHKRFLLRERLNAFFRPVGETLQPLWQFILPWVIEKAGARKRRDSSKGLKRHDLMISFIAILLLASPLIGIALLWRQNRQLQSRLENRAPREDGGSGKSYNGAGGNDSRFFKIG